jgi:hypothetical protein
MRPISFDRIEGLGLVLPLGYRRTMWYRTVVVPKAM